MLYPNKNVKVIQNKNSVKGYVMPNKFTVDEL